QLRVENIPRLVALDEATAAAAEPYRSHPSLPQGSLERVRADVLTLQRGRNLATQRTPLEKPFTLNRLQKPFTLRRALPRQKRSQFLDQLGFLRADFGEPRAAWIRIEL